MPAHHAFPPCAGPLAGGLASQLVMAALAVLCATAVRGEPIEVAAAAASCPSSCLKCDTKGACTSCPATFGLNTAKRCVRCTDPACLDCNANYKRCTRCGYGHYKYLAADGTCPWCSEDCAVDEKLRCNSDGSCQKCSSPDKVLYKGGECDYPPPGCDVNNTLPDGKCKACVSGFVRLPNGQCKECPLLGCDACLANGTCKVCARDYNLQGGKCVPCPYGCQTCNASGACTTCPPRFTLQGGKCLECPFGCLNCTGDPTRCRECGFGGVGPDGGCRECDDPDCGDCPFDYKKCTLCTGPTYIKNGYCADCPPGCAGLCDNNGRCKKCDVGFGRVGKDCVACKVKNCTRCDGDARKCQTCGSSLKLFETGFIETFLYPNVDRTRCIRCKAHAQCTKCRGVGGACVACDYGWGAVGGTCKRCLVANCANCDGDVHRCLGCDGDCSYTWEFDPRTRKCARLDAAPSCLPV